MAWTASLIQDGYISIDPELAQVFKFFNEDFINWEELNVADQLGQSEIPKTVEYPVILPREVGTSSILSWTNILGPSIIPPIDSLESVSRHVPRPPREQTLTYSKDEASIPSQSVKRQRLFLKRKQRQTTSQSPSIHHSRHKTPQLSEPTISPVPSIFSLHAWDSASLWDQQQNENNNNQHSGNTTIFSSDLWVPNHVQTEIEKNPSRLITELKKDKAVTLGEKLTMITSTPISLITRPAYHPKNVKMPDYFFESEQFNDQAPASHDPERPPIPRFQPNTQLIFVANAAKPHRSVPIRTRKRAKVTTPLDVLVEAGNTQLSVKNGQLVNPYADMFLESPKLNLYDRVISTSSIYHINLTNLIRFAVVHNLYRDTAIVQESPTNVNEGRMLKDEEHSDLSAIVHDSLESAVLRATESSYDYLTEPQKQQSSTTEKTANTSSLPKSRQIPSLFHHDIPTSSSISATALFLPTENPLEWVLPAILFIASPRPQKAHHYLNNDEFSLMNKQSKFSSHLYGKSMMIMSKFITKQQWEVAWRIAGWKMNIPPFFSPKTSSISRNESHEDLSVGSLVDQLRGLRITTLPSFLLLDMNDTRIHFDMCPINPVPLAPRLPDPTRSSYENEHIDQSMEGENQEDKAKDKEDELSSDDSSLFSFDTDDSSEESSGLDFDHDKLVDRRSKTDTIDKKVKFSVPEQELEQPTHASEPRNLLSLTSHLHIRGASDTGKLMRARGRPLHALFNQRRALPLRDAAAITLAEPQRITQVSHPLEVLSAQFIQTKAAPKVAPKPKVINLQNTTEQIEKKEEIEQKELVDQRVTIAIDQVQPGQSLSPERFVHSLPAYLFQTTKLELSIEELENFHRPRLPRALLRNRTFSIHPLKPFQQPRLLRVRALERKHQKQQRTGQNLRDEEMDRMEETLLKVNEKKKREIIERVDDLSYDQELLSSHKMCLNDVSDLTGAEGTIVLLEYFEENPIFISNVGMATSLVHYYQKKTESDNPTINRPEGEVIRLDPQATSPFMISHLDPGQLVTAIENNMFIAPAFRHPPSPTDFLVVIPSDPNQPMTIREVNAMYTIGQELPKMVMTKPGDNRQEEYTKSCLELLTIRYFQMLKLTDLPPTVTLKQLTYYFSSATDSMARPILKKFANNRDAIWELNPDKPFPNEDEIMKMLTPESVCEEQSSLAASRRLRNLDLSLYMKQELYALLAKGKEKVYINEIISTLQKKIVKLIDLEFQLAPWNLCDNFVNQKEKLDLRGEGDLTCLGEMFSFTKNLGRSDKGMPIQREKIANTDADLRKLTKDKLRTLCEQIGMSSEKTRMMEKGDMLRFIRNHSDRTNDPDYQKFNRHNPSKATEKTQMVAKTAQEILNRQLRFLEGTEEKNHIPSFQREYMERKQAEQAYRKELRKEMKENKIARHTRLKLGEITEEEALAERNKDKKEFKERMNKKRKEIQLQIQDGVMNTDVFAEQETTEGFVFRGANNRIKQKEGHTFGESTEITSDHHVSDFAAELDRMMKQEAAMNEEAEKQAIEEMRAALNKAPLEKAKEQTNEIVISGVVGTGSITRPGKSDSGLAELGSIETGDLAEIGTLVAGDVADRPRHAAPKLPQFPPCILTTTSGYQLGATSEINKDFAKDSVKRRERHEPVKQTIPREKRSTVHAIDAPKMNMKRQGKSLGARTAGTKYVFDHERLNKNRQFLEPQSNKGKDAMGRYGDGRVQQRVLGKERVMHALLESRNKDIKEELGIEEKPEEKPEALKDEPDAGPEDQPKKPRKKKQDVECLVWTVTTQLENGDRIITVQYDDKDAHNLDVCKRFRQLSTTKAKRGERWREDRDFDDLRKKRIAKNERKRRIQKEMMRIRMEAEIQLEINKESDDESSDDPEGMLRDVPRPLRDDQGDEMANMTEEAKLEYLLDTNNEYQRFSRELMAINADLNKLDVDEERRHGQRDHEDRRSQSGDGPIGVNDGIPIIFRGHNPSNWVTDEERAAQFKTIAITPTPSRHHRHPREGGNSKQCPDCQGYGHVRGGITCLKEQKSKLIEKLEQNEDVETTRLELDEVNRRLSEREKRNAEQHRLIPDDDDSTSTSESEMISVNESEAMEELSFPSSLRNRRGFNRGPTDVDLDTVMERIEPEDFDAFRLTRDHWRKRWMESVKSDKIATPPHFETQPIEGEAKEKAEERLKKRVEVSKQSRVMMRKKRGDIAIQLQNLFNWLLQNLAFRFPLFQESVYDIPFYMRKITAPIDFRIMQTRKEKYTCCQHFLNDVYLICSNCHTFNDPTNGSVNIYSQQADNLVRTVESEFYNRMKLYVLIEGIIRKESEHGGEMNEPLPLPTWPETARQKQDKIMNRQNHENRRRKKDKAAANDTSVIDPLDKANQCLLLPPLPPPLLPPPPPVPHLSHLHPQPEPSSRVEHSLPSQPMSVELSQRVQCATICPSIQTTPPPRLHIPPLSADTSPLFFFFQYQEL
ncbi:putative Transcription initiation factor TFIID subunit 1 [Blattamonas nauphoetae]|uniref:Transcription initiation factor TFIID subunit 1 n=1 Tax=Blattamonas nauphoetae TaxID=2049346 RepID=A0ABQ9XP39_9EUKA|nr:putative Transcription initiation factor TFIID subunit 1 [Blattamonas nauphoetae]